MEKDLKHHLICPYCHRGEVLSDGKAPITVRKQRTSTTTTTGECSS